MKVYTKGCKLQKMENPFLKKTPRFVFESRVENTFRNWIVKRKKKMKRIEIFKPETKLAYFE
jgi:hypothetical protein